MEEKNDNNVKENVERLFSEFNSEYNNLKQMIEEEFKDYEYTLNQFRKEANNHKNIVKPRNIMEAMLPILSDIINDVLDSEDLNNLKKIIEHRYNQLYRALSMQGVELKMHKRGESIASDEKADAKGTPTPNPALNQKVARSNKIGCVIRGEERPILEEIEIYVFQNDNATNLVEEVEDSAKVLNDQVNDAISCFPASDDNGLDTPKTIEKNNEGLGKVIIREESICFLSPIILKMLDSDQQIILIDKDLDIKINDNWKKLKISTEDITEREWNICLDTQILSKNFSLNDVNLEYRVKCDKVEKRLFFEIKNDKTSELLVREPLSTSEK